MAKLSVLDLAPILEGGTPADALSRSLDLARHTERLGYERFWVAEHHNMPGIASAATSVVIGHIAGGTERIRVGAGGVMLPNHSPLVIAEQFGTLASLYPKRIDLGLGRAPGTDGLTAQALRRTLASNPNDFPQDVVELQRYLQPPAEGQRVLAVPGAGTEVPLWILGSSLFGAQLAAILGLPFAFASHFAPQMMEEAIAIYRQRFEPSDQLQAPYVMLGYNVCAAPTDEEAQLLRTSYQQAFVNLRRGIPSQLPPPKPDFDATLNPGEKRMLAELGKCAAVGAPATIAPQIQSFIDQTAADELIIATTIFNHESRLASYTLCAQAMGLSANLDDGQEEAR